EVSMATLFPFENHGSNWNEANQEKLQAFKNVDFIKFSYPHYDNPSQFTNHNRFAISNTDEAYLFYDEELETNLKYLLELMKNEANYPITYLTFDRLNEIAQE
ncbi:SLOG family protein, partial [Streptococcus suis]